jgi:hypothetical protein
MYSAETYKQPFWAENSGFMTGRDPLGIQNSSITVYSRLLPGMTNLTLRIRYYGLYCWLLSEYDKKPKEGEIKSLEHQFNFIRRAELIIAYLMLKFESTQTSIIGSDYASRNIAEIEELGYYNVKKGADKLKETKKGSVYWDFAYGALGQYYAGSLISLDLIEIIDKFFHIRKKGLELAAAFEKSIKPETRSLFLSVLDSGVLTNNDIRQLEEFAIDKITKGKEEWSFYNDLLLQDDGIQFRTSDGKLTSKRKETIKLYLEYFKKNSALPFPAYQFQIVESEGSLNDTRIGWYYYFINEVIHYCIETIFWAMLVELDGKNIPVNEYIGQIVELALEQTNTNFGFNKNQTVFDILSLVQPANLIDELKKLEHLTKSPSNSSKALSFAIRLLFRTYLTIKGKLNKMADFENLNYLQNQKGIISEYIQTFVTDFWDYEFHQYINRIVKTIINDHIATAYRKMGNGEANLLKFVIEDGIIGHIQTMSPKFTNPRLRTLYNFLFDLFYLDKEGALTAEGEELLIQIS